MPAVTSCQSIAFTPPATAARILPAKMPATTAAAKCAACFQDVLDSKTSSRQEYNRKPWTEDPSVSRSVAESSPTLYWQKGESIS